jgi:chromosome segregation ATPase
MAQYLVPNIRNEAREELDISGWTKHPRAKIVLDIRTGPDGDEGETMEFKADTPQIDVRTRTISRQRGTRVVSSESYISSSPPTNNSPTIVRRPSFLNGNSPTSSSPLSTSPSTPTPSFGPDMELMKKQNGMLKEELQNKRQELVSLREEVDKLKQSNNVGLVEKMQVEIDELKDKLFGYEGYDDDDENSIESLKQNIKSLEQKLVDKESLIVKLSGSDSAIDELRKDRDQFKIALEDALDQLGTAESKLKQKEKEFNELSEQSSSFESSSIELKQLRAKIEILEKEKDELETTTTRFRNDHEQKMRAQKETLEEEFSQKLSLIEEKHLKAMEQSEKKFIGERVALENQLNSMNNMKQTLEDQVSSLKEQIQSLSRMEQDVQQAYESSKKQLDSLKLTDQENQNRISQLQSSLDTIVSDIKSVQQELELSKTENGQLKKRIEEKEQQTMNLQLKSTGSSDNADELKKQFEKLYEQEQTIQTQKTEILKLQKQVELANKELSENLQIIHKLKQTAADNEQKLKVSEGKVLELQVNLDHISKRSQSSGSQTEHMKDEIKELKDGLRQKESENKQQSQKIQSLLSQVDKLEQERNQLEQKKLSLEEKLKEVREDRQNLIGRGRGNSSAVLDNDTLEKLRKVKKDNERLAFENEKMEAMSQQAIDKFEKCLSEKKQLEDRIAELQRSVKQLKLENNDLLQSGGSNNGKVDSEIVNRLQYKLERLETDKEELIAQVENQTNEVITLKQQVKNATNTIVKLKRQLSSSQEEMKNSQHYDQERNDLFDKLDKATEEIKKLRADIKTLKVTLKQKVEKLASLKKSLQEKVLHEKNEHDKKLIDIEHYEIKNKTTRVLAQVADLDVKEKMILDPIGSVKRSVLAIIDYYETKAEEAEGDLESISNGMVNHELTKLVNNLLCESLVSVFKTGFTGPSFWFFTTAHYWHTIEEIAALYKTTAPASEKQYIKPETLLGGKLAGAVNYINMEIQPDTLHCYSLEEIKFRALILHCTNQQNLHDMVQFIFTHKAQLARYYSIEDAIVTDTTCQKKLVRFLTLLCKLPFSIPLVSVFYETDQNSV